MASAPPTANHEAVTTLQTAGEGSISALKVGEMRARFEGSSSARMAQNAVCKHSVDEVAQSRGIVTTSDATFSHVLDDWAATNQKATGRCWMFAGLNLLRVGAMQEMNLKEFEFSQNYTFFWEYACAFTKWTPTNCLANTDFGIALMTSLVDEMIVSGKPVIIFERDDFPSCFLDYGSNVISKDLKDLNWHIFLKMIRFLKD